MKKNFFSILITIVIITLSYNLSNAQWSVSFEVMPKLTCAKFVGYDVVPAIFKLNKFTPSVSFGAYLNRQITKNKEVFFGFNYHINNYRSFYYWSDYTADKPWYYKTKSISGTEFHEPQIGFRYSNFNLFKMKNNYLRIGLAYRYLDNLDVLIKTGTIYENSNGGLDTIQLNKLILDNNAFRFSLILEYGKNYKLGRRDRLLLDVGLSVRLSEADSRVRNEMIIANKKYEFTFLRNSSHIGLSLRMTYNRRQKKT